MLTRAGSVGLMLLFWGAPGVVVAQVRAPDQKAAGDSLIVAIWEFPPFQVAPLGGEAAGVAVDILNAVARRGGFGVRYVRVSSFGADGVRLLNADSVDLFMPVGILPSRDQTADFTIPVLTLPIHIFVRNGDRRISRLADLSGRRVAVVSGNAGAEIAAEEDLDAIVFDSLEADAAIYALVAGTADAMIYPAPLMRARLAALGLSQLVRIIDNPIREVRRGFVVREGNSELLTQLNPLIGELLLDSEYDEILNRWFGEPPPFWNPRRIVGAFSLMLLLMWAGHYVRIWHLNRRLTRSRSLLQASLDEKEMLLREVHHRVKNNLQIVSSLLYFQEKSLPEGVDGVVFQELRDRIRAMSLVHESLYQSENLASVDFSSYLSALVNQLGPSFRTDAQGVKIALDTGGVHLPIEVAVPLGMMANEMITNALKHAFRGRAEGQIRAHAGIRDGFVRLEVADDGVGLSEESRASTEATFGFRLMNALATQLDGKLDVSVSAGTVVAIEAPLPRS